MNSKFIHCATVQSMLQTQAKSHLLDKCIFYQTIKDATYI